MDNFSTAIAAVVRADMEAAGLSVNALAIRSGIHRNTLTRLLAGAPYSTTQLATLAAALGTNVSAWTQRAETAVA